MYHTIIIPVTLGQDEQNIALLTKAQKILGAKEIILLHVVEELPEFITKLAHGVGFDNGSATIENAYFDNTKNATKQLKNLIKQSGVDARIEVPEGKTYDCIINSANKNNADLIIIRSHQSEIQHYLLGSTAEKVVRHAKCAVLVER